MVRNDLIMFLATVTVMFIVGAIALTKVRVATLQQEALLACVEAHIAHGDVVECTWK